MEDELDLLHTDKRPRFLHIPIIVLGVCSQACPNYEQCYCQLSIKLFLVFKLQD